MYAHGNFPIHKTDKNIAQVLKTVSLFWKQNKAFVKNSSLSAIWVWASQANTGTVWTWVRKHQYILKDAATAEKWTKAEKGNSV